MCVCVFDSLSLSKKIWAQTPPLLLKSNHGQESAIPQHRSSNLWLQPEDLMPTVYRAISGATMTADVDELAQELAKVRDQDRVPRMGV